MKNYFVGASRELSLVKWPTKKQLYDYTLVTLVFVFAFAGFLALVDWLLGLPLGMLTGM